MLRNLGRKSARNPRKFSTRRPIIESLEDRRMFWGSPECYSDTTNAGNTCCTCGVTITNGDNASTTAGNSAAAPTYNSGPQPHPIFSFTTTDPSEIGTASGATWIAGQVEIGGLTSTPVYFDPNTVPSGGDIAFQFQVDTSSLSSGQYEWTASFSNDVESTPREFTSYHIIVNRDGGDFGDGWSMPELNQLVVQSGNDDDDLNGVALITGDNNVAWFEDTGGGTFSRNDEESSDTTYTNLTYADGTYTLTAKDGSKELYTTVEKGSQTIGLLQETIDRDGNTRTYTYADENGDSVADDITSITYGNGHETTFQYSGGKITSETDFADTSDPMVTSFAYSGGKMVSVTEPDPDGSGSGHPLTNPVTYYTYDSSNGLLNSITNPDGNKVSLGYDSFRKVHTMTHGDGDPELTIDAFDDSVMVNLATTGYDSSHLASIPAMSDMKETDIDANGNHTEILRDRFGNITQSTDALGTVTTYDRSDDGRLNNVYQPDPNNPNPGSQIDTMSYGYSTSDATANITSISQPIGAEYYSYDSTFNEVNQYQDAKGHITWYDIDSSNGDVLSMTQIIGSDDRFSSETDDLTTTYTYTTSSDHTSTGVPIGLVKTITDPRGIETVYDYYSTGMVHHVYNAYGTANATTTTYTYTPRDLLATVTDPMGYVTTYAYDELNRLTSETDPDPDGTGSGHPLTSPVTSYQYDAKGNVTTVIDPNSYVTRYTYTDDNLTSQTIQPIADPTASAYSVSQNQSAASVSPSWSSTGATATWTFNSSNSSLNNSKKYLVMVRWTAGSTYDSDAEWDVYGNTSSDPLASASTDLNQAPSGYVDSSGNVWKILGAFSPYSNSLTVKLKDVGTAGLLTADAVQLLEVGGVSQNDYDEANNLTKMTDPAGNVTDYGYDQLNRQTSMTTHPTSTTTTVTTSTYNSLGWLNSVTDGQGDITVYGYDSNGRQTQQAQLGTAGLDGSYTIYGGADQTRHDSQINFTTTSSDFGFTDSGSGFTATWKGYVYIDPAHAGDTTFYLNNTQTAQLSIDNQSVLYNGSGSEESVDLNMSGGWHPIEIDYYSSSTGSRSLTLSYMLNGESKTVVPSSALRSSVATSSYQYDNVGNLTQLTDPDGNSTTWDYDDVNRVDQESNDYGPRYYTYDKDSNLKQYTDRDGRITQYDYDYLNRETAERWRNSGNTANIHTIPYTYDADSRLTSASEGGVFPESLTASDTFTYDHLGRATAITSFVVGTSAVLSQTFDPNSNRTGVSATYSYYDGSAYTSYYPVFTTSYAYDALSRMTSITQGSLLANFTYNADGQFNTISRYNSSTATTSALVATSTYGYDGAGRITSLAYTNSNGSGTTFAGYGFSYDAANRLTDFTNTQSSSQERKYAYDALSQLTNVGYAGNAATHNDEVYAYDPNGNRTSSTVSSTTSAYTLGTTGNGNNQIASDGVYDYDYDAEGNLIKKTKISDGSYTTYTYDYRNRLTEVTTSDSSVHVKYLYDAFDRLVGWRNVALGVNQNYVFDGNNIVMSFTSGDLTPVDTYESTGTYLWGPWVDMLLEQSDSESEISGWTVTDQENSNRDYLTGSGSSVSMSSAGSFTAFGRLHNSSEFLPVIGGYTGKFYDPYTDLQLNGERWYDEALGRWMSQDPIGFAGDHSNLYRYVGNSPTNYIDPTGEFPFYSPDSWPYNVIWPNNLPAPNRPGRIPPPPTKPAPGGNVPKPPSWLIPMIPGGGEAIGLAELGEDAIPAKIAILGTLRNNYFEDPSNENYQRLIDAQKYFDALENCEKNQKEK